MSTETKLRLPEAKEQITKSTASDNWQAIYSTINYQSLCILTSVSTYCQRNEVGLTENCDKRLGELFQSTVREQMMSCNSWKTVMYDSCTCLHITFNKSTKSASVKKRNNQTYALLPPSRSASPSRSWAQRSFLQVPAHSMVAEHGRKRTKVRNTVAGIVHCWNWWALTLMKFEFSTASWTRSKRTWGSPSSWPMWYDFSRSEDRTRLHKTFSGRWIRHTSSTTPPVGWTNKKKMQNFERKIYLC